MAENPETQIKHTADQNSETAADSATATPGGEEVRPEAEAEPTLAEDFERLQKMNLLKAVLLRMQGGRHPSVEIDALLRRRLNFSRDSFQGPYIIRLISTLIMIFIAATVCWAVLWILASGFELNYFVRILSTGMASLVAAIAGIAIFHPSSLPDENLLKQAIDNEMQAISKKVQADVDTDELLDKSSENSDLVDSSIEEMSKKKTVDKSRKEEPLAAMPPGLDSIRDSSNDLTDDEIDSNNKNLTPDIDSLEEEKLDENSEQPPRQDAPKQPSE